jgi:predicted ArsR family transcriptional regulator
LIGQGILTTRDRIIELLRRESRTVEQLAVVLGVTDNAVRLHLSALERDGIVQQAGVRREGAVGKPATIYEIAPASEPSFSRAYVPFLSTLLAALGERLSPHQVRALMRDVGRRLVGTKARADADLETRVQLASDVLTELGALTTIERQADGSLMIRGCGCPLSVAVEQRKEVCVAVQQMLGEITGCTVREHCDRSARPQCHFVVER